MEDGNREKVSSIFSKFEGIPKGTKLSEIYSRLESEI